MVGCSSFKHSQRHRLNFDDALPLCCYLFSGCPLGMCKGQLVFKFCDSSGSVHVWLDMSMDMSLNICGRLGLVWGKTSGK